MLTLIYEMSHSSIVFKLRSQKRRYVKQSMIILIMVSSGLFLNFTASNNENFEILDVKLDTTTTIGFSDQSSLQSKIKLDSNRGGSNFKSQQFSGSLNTLDSFSPNGVLLSTEKNVDAASSNIPFTYTENFTDSSTYTSMNNQDSFTVQPLEDNTISQVDANVSTYLSSADYVLEDDATNGFNDISGAVSYAQGMKISYFNKSTLMTLYSFNITTLQVVNNADVTGEIWSAQYNTTSTRWEPASLLASKTTSFPSGAGGFTNHTFLFDTPVVISTSDTEVNATDGAGHLFFVLYTPGTDTVNVYTDDGADGTDDGETYSYTMTTPPTDPGDWTSQAYDFTLNYNASFNLDPTLFDTIVYIDNTYEVPIPSNRGFTNSTLRIGSTNFKVNYSSSIAASYGIIPLINVTYTSFVNLQYNPNIMYSITPNLQNITWAIQLNSTSFTNSSSTIVKYFTIPSNFTITSVYLNNTKIDNLLGEYQTGIDVNGDQIVYFEVAHGDYSIFANSTNLLNSATMNSYVDSGGFVEQNNATMGTLFPSVLNGDTIKANITNVLSLIGGNYNASLRDVSGSIINPNFTNEAPFVSILSFSMDLEPNIPTGYWSFQFRWFNGTAAGAVALEFEIYPVATLNLISPSSASIDVLEADIVYIEVETLDQSHNSNWGSAGIVSWDFDSNIIMDYNGASGSYHNYSTTIDTSIGSNNVQPNQAYTIVITFSDGPFTITTEFVMTTFYRGGSQLSNSAPIEFESTLSIEFRPVNLTQGGSFKNPSITFQLTSNQVLLDSGIPVYNAGTGNYSIVVQWNSEFKLGSSNEIIFNWTLAGFGDSTSFSHVSTTFTFEVVDSGSPSLTLQPDIFYNEGVTGNNITWDPLDPHPGVFNLTLEGTPLLTNQVWSNSSNIEISVDGLEARAAVYTYAIDIYDLEGNVVADSVDVTVSDVIVHTFTSPASDIDVTEGQISETLSWTLNDLHGKNYTIVQNGSGIVDSGPWTTDGQIVNFNISTLLTLGGYNFTIQIYDESENYAEYSTIVTVVDNTNPNLPLPPVDVFYEEFDLGETVTWAVTDTNAQNYTLYLDEAPVDNQVWTSGVDIVILVQGLSLGQHNYTIEIFDTTGNSVIDTVMVTVTDTVVPSVTGPVDFEYTEGDTNNEITWVVSDSHPDTYTIYRNEVEIVPSTPWSSGSIDLDIDGLPIGTYNFTIFLVDTSGNVNRDTVDVEVKDPAITYTKLVPFDIKNNLYESDVETISILGWTTMDDFNITGAQLNATLIAIDVDGLNNETRIYQTTFSSTDDEFILILDYSDLLIGTYQWIFTLEKAEFETQIASSSLYEVVIHPHSLAIEILFDTTLVQSEEFFISANVTYNDLPIADGLSLNSITNQKSAEGITVSFVITAINDAGTEVTFNKQGETDANGFVRVSLDTGETESLVDIISIVANIEALAGYTGEFSETRTDLKVKIKEKSEFYVLLDDIYNFIVEQIIYVVIALATTLIVIIYFLRRLRKRRSKFTMYARESEDASAEIDGLRSMHGIIMTAGSTGIPFYEYTFTSARTSIDSALISGITTALSMFLNELNEQVLGFEHMERAGVSITSHKSDLSTMMVISDAPLPPIILEQLKNGHHAIESKFSKQLMIPERMMDIEPINITNELVSKSLKLNLKEDVIIRTNNLKKLQKRKSISRKIRNDMGLLKKLNKLSDDTHEPLNLEMIIAYLESKNIDHATACRIIYLSYVNFIIVPI